MNQRARVLRRVVMWLALPGSGVAVWLVLAYLGMVPLWPRPPRPPTLRATLGEDDLAARAFCVAFSPDGQRLACGGWSDGRVKLWDVATGQFTSTFEAQDVVGPVGSVAFSPDSRVLAGGLTLKGGGP